LAREAQKGPSVRRILVVLAALSVAGVLFAGSALATNDNAAASTVDVAAHDYHTVTICNETDAHDYH
jgi:hypothetical protein